MVWDGAWKATIALSSVRLSKACRPTATAFPAWCWRSLTVFHSRCREEQDPNDIRDPAAYPAEAFPERRGHGYRPAVSRCHGAGILTGRRDESTRSHGVSVCAEWHHHEAMDAGGGRE